MKFFIISSNQINEDVNSLLLLSILPEIKCAWCGVCKHKIFIHNKLPEHPHPVVYTVDVDNITKVCWITQKYRKLLEDALWTRELKRMKLEPIYYASAY